VLIELLLELHGPSWAADNLKLVFSEIVIHYDGTQSPL
jgi:hypothetical protein